MRILVTGSTGYIAGRLIPQLLERGHAVRALARKPQVLRGRAWFERVEVVQGDVMDAASLPPTLKDIHTAYYLIHNMTAGRGYTERELEGARNFARAVEAAGVEHIIYLGGLADPEQHIAPHMRSRIETGAALRAGKVPVTEFRAGVIAGSGSISFEMIRFMTELFPVIPGPRWLKHKSQPIATQNVIDYLLAALENWDGHGQVFEIGGPQVTSYQDLMIRYARLRGHRRAFLLLPYLPVWFMAFGIDRMTPVPYRIAHALVGGLSDDSIVIHDDARRVFPEVRLIDFDAAAREALTHLHPHKIQRVWDDGQSVRRVLRHEGFFIHHLALDVDTAPGRAFKVITDMGRENSWPFANWLWKILGRIDGPPFPGGEEGHVSPCGDFANETYEVDPLEPDCLLLLKLRREAPGEAWIEWRVADRPGGSRVSQTFYLAPRGFGCFLHWYWLYPIRAFLLQRVFGAIAKRTQGK
jgi:uncharacterized protein YbjT (DUF2867 family)